jgi:beta-lactamase superfamily II metal-dependent hydrolase
MEIRIFDVTHGFCAYLIGDNGNVMLFDCGHNGRTGFRPSDYLPAHGCTDIEHLIIQNFDQDHISDLSNLMRVLTVQRFFRNQSISADQLQSIKEKAGPITTSMQTAIDMHRDYIYPVKNPPVFPSTEFKTFWNSYPTFVDTNNLSVVSFIHYDGMGMVFPGDLEKEAWNELLKRESFRDHLRRVSIFVASHHGRENGYCEDVFKYCSPHIIIISDKEITHETQKQNYAKHASGVPWNGGPERRYILTTRSDGMIKITKQIGQGYHITI